MKKLFLINSFAILVTLLSFENNLVLAKTETTQPKNIEQLREEYNFRQTQLSVDSIIRYERIEEKITDLKESQLEHRKFTIWFQYWTSLIIFITVIILVIGGFYLAYLQFKVDKTNNTSNESSLEISSKGIKISSSVIGLVILTISFAFFYLYIEEVHKIYELPSINNTQNEED